MKRFISILLAALMCVSVLGGIVVAGAEDAAEERAYNLLMPTALTEEIWDYSVTGGALQLSVVPLKGYGDHGFKYWTADTYTRNAATKERVLQFVAAGLRMYANYGGKNLLDNNDGVRVALALEKPSTVPSFYTVTVARTSGAPGIEIYTGKLVEDNRDIAYYMSPAMRNGHTYSLSSSNTTMSELIYNNGTDDHVFSVYTGLDAETKLGNNIQLASVTLKPVSVSSIELLLDTPATVVGDTATASVATILNKKYTGIVDDYVTYTSSDTDVATIAADGTITAHQNGTTTITATVGGLSSSADFTVGKRTYLISKPKILYSDAWDTTQNGKNIQSSMIPLIGFGNHGYKYWDTDETSIANQAINVRTLNYSTYIRLWSEGTAPDGSQPINNENGAKLALVLKTPPKGFYKITHTSGASDGQIENLDICMTEISAEDEAVAKEERPQVETFITKKNIVKTGDSSNTLSHSYQKIIAAGGENNLIWAASVDPKSAFSFAKIELIPLDVTAIELAAGKTELEMNETTVLTASANDQPIAHSFVTYENLNPTVVKVEGDGTVTALATGEATIKATANGLSDTVRITVAEPAPEEPGEEISGTVTFGVDNSRSLSYLREFITAPGYTVGSPAQVAVGTKVTLTAKDADDEGFKFRFWKVSGRFYSTEKQITLTIARNTSVIAVYDDVFFTTAKYVEFWNGDKDFISEVVTSAETLDAKYFPKDPEMTGMRFIGWYLDDETPFTPETVIKDGYTRVAAKYETLDTEYTVKVNGEENKGTYNSPVSVSAPEAFTYWKLGEEKLSFRRAFEFFNYGNAELISVFDESAKAIPTVVIDKNLGAAFITYDTPAGYERIEAGIIFGPDAGIKVNSAYTKASAKNEANFGQFTAKPMNDETYARGYQIFKKDGVVRVIYTDAIAIR